MLDHSEEITEQPGEFKIEKEDINDLTNEQLKQFLIKRKQDVEAKMLGKKITDFYKVGIIVKLQSDDNLYQIVSRFDYSDEQVMYDYKGVLLESTNIKYKYFDHNQIEKAFRLDVDKGTKIK